MPMKINLKIISFLSIIIICIWLGCYWYNSDKREYPDINKSEALFDFFIYEGKDTFYEENPLSSDDSFYTPILPGWYSDPSICANENGDYFLVTSTFSYYPGVPIFHSRDLVNWKQIGHVLNRPSQLVGLEGQELSGGIFAPAIQYNPLNKTYYLITTNIGCGNFFVKTKDPFAGEWSDPIMLPSIQGIDPSFFFDNDGKAYIVNNDDAPDNKPEYGGHRTIRIQEFDVNSDQTIGPRKVIVDKGVSPKDKPIWIEGPHLYKINGEYILIAAEGGTGGWHSEVVFKSKSPFGEFVPWKKNPILTQRTLNPDRSYPIACAGHADIIQANEGDWWAVFLACRPINNRFENLGRETFLMPVKWSEDGFPYITQGDEVIAMINNREGVKRMENVTFGNFKIREEFNDSLLDVQWMTLRGPANDLYSLKKQPGFLTLNCADKSSKERCVPAYIGRRMQHHEFEVVTRMYFNPDDMEGKAGILLLKDETHQYFMSVGKMHADKVISLKRIEKNEDKVLTLEKLPADAERFDLKVVSKGLFYDFYYSLDKGKTWKMLCNNVDASFLSTAKADGFTGSTIGLYATRK